MPRNVRSARGEMVDFDALVVKQQLAQAPMNVEVARRKEFIDNKEGRARGQRAAAVQGDVTEIPAEIQPIEVEPPVQQTTAMDFEPEDESVKKK